MGSAASPALAGVVVGALRSVGAEPHGRHREDRESAARPRNALAGIDAAPAVSSRREPEVPLLHEPDADRDDVGIELDPGVRADLSQRGLHAERGAVGPV